MDDSAWLGAVRRGSDRGYNDFVEADYSGPSPPDDTYGHRFKLLAPDSSLGLAPEARKTVVQMTVAMDQGTRRDAVRRRVRPRTGAAF
jgi:phosphatidylethanolamine-binding protein (PEBP) family uncharacterized protein